MCGFRFVNVLLPNSFELCSLYVYAKVHVLVVDEDLIGADEPNRHELYLYASVYFKFSLSLLYN